MNNDPITIKVTQRHIDHGRRGDCSYCPIALAISEVIAHSPALDGPFWQIIKVFDNADIQIRGRRYVTSLKATEWMTDFDEMRPVQPTEFVLVPHELEDEYEF
jgi:hypothetical protein